MCIAYFYYGGFMKKIVNKECELIYYYDDEQYYNMALESKRDFERRALASVIITSNTNSIIKCRFDLEKYFDRAFS